MILIESNLYFLKIIKVRINTKINDIYEMWNWDAKNINTNDIKRIIFFWLSKKLIKYAMPKIEKGRPKVGFQNILVCCKKHVDVRKNKKDNLKSSLLNIFLFNLNKYQNEIIEKKIEI